jgi:GT2 family glycosyltransferase
MGVEGGTSRPRPLIGEPVGELATGDQGRGFIGVLAVMVLYRRALSDSQTWTRLRSQVASLSPSISFHLLVCDNGPAASAAPIFPSWVEYTLADENRGLAWAYNHGLARARQLGAEWLLMLDQDTSLPSDFLTRMLRVVAMLRDRQAIGAIIPQLVSADGSPYSPVVAKLGRENMVPRGFTGVGEGDIRPYNSAAMVRVSSIEACGGYDRRFWLDYLDHATFHALTRCGYKLWIAGDIQVEHHLSLHDDRSSVGEAHFDSFVKAESAFRDLYGSWFEGLLFTARLFLRSINQRRRGDPDFFVRSTNAVLRSRLRTPRRERIRAWEQAMEAMGVPPKIRQVESGKWPEDNRQAWHKPGAGL